MSNPEKRTRGDRRMHEGHKPGLDAPRDETRHEEPVRLDGDNSEDGLIDFDRREQNDRSDARERQSSALGGDVATRSGTAPTPASDRDEAKERSS
jgi:hypothetical protein